MLPTRADLGEANTEYTFKIGPYFSVFTASRLLTEQPSSGLHAGDQKSVCGCSSGFRPLSTIARKEIAFVVLAAGEVLVDDLLVGSGRLEAMMFGEVIGSASPFVKQ